MVELFRSPRRLLLFCFEGVLVAILVVIAACVRMGVHEGLTIPHIQTTAAFIALILQGSFYYTGFYDLATCRQPQVAFNRVLQGLVFGGTVILVTFYIVKPLEIGRGIFLVALAMTAIVLPTWRVASNSVSEGAQFVRRTLILGSGDLARELAQRIRDRRDLGLELVGMLTRDRIHVGSDPLIIGTYRDLLELTTRLEVQYVLVAYPDRRGTLPVEQLLEVKFRGIEVEEGVKFYEREMGKIFVRELKPSQLIFSEGFNARATTRRLKRLMDAVFSTIGLALAAPLALLTAVAIKLESPGPVLYKQVRAGEHGRPFTILKFRSMRNDAEKHGAQFAQENDPRVTRVGAFIRKTRIDELPQLWNVLQGEMSMVGPRPERPIFIEQLEQQIPFFKQRLYVRPGVTGHAQVRCRYGASAEDMLEKLQYDLYYIKSYSVLFDLSIMLDTVKVVLFRIGSR